LKEVVQRLLIGASVSGGIHRASCSLSVSALWLALTQTACCVV
jgi:hypothetical protein